MIGDRSTPWSVRKHKVLSDTGELLVKKSDKEHDVRYKEYEEHDKYYSIIC